MSFDRPYDTKEIAAVFDALGIKRTTEPTTTGGFDMSRVKSGQIVFTRLSDNSTPPPTGRFIDANMERASK